MYLREFPEGLDIGRKITLVLLALFSAFKSWAEK